MVRTITLNDGTVVPISEEGDDEVEQVGETPQESEVDDNDLSGITQVDREDVLGKPDGNSGEIDISDVVGLDEEEDMEDLFEYDGDNDDYPGTPASQGEVERKPPRIIRRTPRPDAPPSQGLGGMKD